MYNADLLGHQNSIQAGIVFEGFRPEKGVVMKTIFYFRHDVWMLQRCGVFDHWAQQSIRAAPLCCIWEGGLSCLDVSYCCATL